MNQNASTADRIDFHEDTNNQTEEQVEPSLIDWSAIWKPMALIVGIFVLFFFLPVDSQRFTGAVVESLALAKWYAQEHVLLCLVPAFFIAGAIAVFVSQGAVMKYLGAGAPKALSYGVASVSGSILAVCSCTVLPLFAGIWKRGAGLGPAVAFLYSGPAINVLAIILTARILGPELGAARAVGAVLFSVLIGLCMHLMFRREEKAKAAAASARGIPISKESPSGDRARPMRKRLRGSQAISARSTVPALSAHSVTSEARAAAIANNLRTQPGSNRFRASMSPPPTRGQRIA